MNVVELISPYVPLFVVLGAIATVLGVAFGFYKASHSRQVAMLKDRINQLERELAQSAREDPKSLELLHQQLGEVKDENAQMRERCAALEDKLRTKELDMQ